MTAPTTPPPRFLGPLVIGDDSSLLHKLTCARCGAIYDTTSFEVTFCARDGEPLVTRE